MAKAFWEKEIMSFGDKTLQVPENIIEFVDANVLAELPAGTKVKGIFPYGASVWTRTAEIQTEQVDGSELSFFLKVCQNETGKGMMSGEFASMSAIHAAVPGLAPAPIAWGTYASDPNTYFFVMSFIEMTDEIPELDTLPAKLAELHQNGLSPTGKFGFPVQNYQGALPQVVTWRDTWEEAFTEGLRAMVIREEKAQGPNEEMIRLLKQLFDRVIPRLLRPLQTGGRSIVPRLVHGDLWDGNCSTSIDTDQPVVFDASCLYAHNEYDMAAWRCPLNKLGKAYEKAYHRHFPISAPEEDRDDRVLLYCIRFQMCGSALYPGNHSFRNLIIDDLKNLVAKHPEGYDEWEKTFQFNHLAH